MARSFIAVRPPGHVRSAIVELQSTLGPGHRLVPPEQLHVTLRFWSDAPPAAIVTALDGSTPPSTIALVGPSVGELGRDAVMLPVTGLDDLAAIVRTATAGVPPPVARPFVGHLTVARRKRGVSEGSVSGRPFAASFPVRSIELVVSELRPTGAVHRRLRSWPVPTDAP